MAWCFDGLHFFLNYYLTLRHTCTSSKKNSAIALCIELTLIYNDTVSAAGQSELSDQYLANQEESLTKEPEPPATEAAEPEIEIAGVVNWNRPSGIAFGAATSLYERHPVSGETAGNPLADVSQSTFLNELFPPY